MVIGQINVNNQQTRDNFSQEPDTQTIIKLKSDVLQLIQKYIIINKKSIGHSWIVGSSTNGLVGTNTATQDGQQQVVGSAGRSTDNRNVINSNKNHIETYDFNDLEDTDATTADWNTTTGQVDFDDAELLQSKSVALGSNTITSATINVEGTNIDKLTFKLSASDNLNAHYKLNGNSADSTINAYDGTDTDMTYGAGKINSGATFDGSTGRIQLAASNSLITSDNDWTISVWMNAASFTTDYARLFTLHRLSTIGTAMSYRVRDTGVLNLTYHDGTTQNSIDFNALSTSTWYNVVGTYNGTDIKTYVDSSLIDTTTDTFSGFGTFNGFLGSFGDLASSLFDGMLDDVRMYNTALASPAINEIYNSGTGTENELPSSNFETVTASTLHSFTSTGKSLRYQMTATSPSVSVTRTLITYN